MSKHDDIQHLDPDQLLTGFSKTPFVLAFLFSIFAHVIFLGLFSMTPLLNMVLPQAQEKTREELKEVESDPQPEEAATDETAVTETPAASQVPRGATAQETEEGQTTEEGTSDDDDFDIDLDVLNR